MRGGGAVGLGVGGATVVVAVGYTMRGRGERVGVYVVVRAKVGMCVGVGVRVTIGDAVAVGDAVREGGSMAVGIRVRVATAVLVGPAVTVSRA